MIVQFRYKVPKFCPSTYYSTFLFYIVVWRSSIFHIPHQTITSFCSGSNPPDSSICFKQYFCSICFCFWIRFLSLRLSQPLYFPPIFFVPAPFRRLPCWLLMGSMVPLAASVPPGYKNRGGTPTQDFVGRRVPLPPPTFPSLADMAPLAVKWI